MAYLALFCYFSLVFIVGFFSIKKHMTSKDFIIGSRSLNFWLTALAAHASDMSSWLFLAYPAAVFTSGSNQIVTALGLITFMWLNWTFIAKKLRTQTEKLESQTLSAFFEKSIKEKSGNLRLFTSLMSLFFYTIYIASGIYGIGLLSETLFQIPYLYGCLFGLLIIIPYVFFGGYITLAWIDLFQGLFLLVVICLVPLFYFVKTPDLKIDFQLTGPFTSQLMLFLGWGLGYFGQPHIITKFMGIKNPNEIKKSKLVGMSWMGLSLLAATFVGLIGPSIFKDGLNDPQVLFLKLVQNAFSPFLAYFMLCAVIAATINATSSQLLVLASTLTEDIFHRFINQKANSDKLLLISRVSVVTIALASFLIAYFKISSIYELVLYAWSGLGGTFGPLVIYCLYFKNPSLKTAWSALASGSITAIIWPFFAGYLGLSIESLLPSFIISFAAIFISRIK
jgi:sodium/proline symporter